MPLDGLLIMTRAPEAIESMQSALAFFFAELIGVFNAEFGALAVLISD